MKADLDENDGPRSLKVGKSGALIVAAILVFLIDRFGKFSALDSLAVGERRPLFGDVLSLTRVETSGAALGLFSDWSEPAQAIIFGMISVVCALLVLAFYRGLARGEHGSAAALGAILAGVISNALDRFRFGVGIDFVHLGAPDAAHLLAFNLAGRRHRLGGGHPHC